MPAAIEGGRLRISAADGVRLEVRWQGRAFQRTENGADRRVADVGPPGFEVGQGPRRRRRLLAQRLGTGSAGFRS